MADLNARDIAVLALRDRSGNVSARLARLLDEKPLSSQDRSLARELALGTVRHKATLDAVLRAFLKNPDKRLPSPLTEILHVALLQMLFLDRVPDFAAVNAAVEQARTFHHKRQSGFVNGVLRSVSRAISDLRQGPPPCEADVIPVSPLAYRNTTRAVFASPSAKPAQYLAGAYSLPVELAQRWLEQFGSLAGAAKVAAHANARAPLIVRVNSLKGDLSAAIASLRADGVEATPHANGLSLVLEPGVNIAEMAALKSGLIQPQDPTATAVTVAAKPAPKMRVLDFCAAPGTKTTHLAELMNNTGSITAADVSPEKLQRIEDNCRRMGIDIVTTMVADRVGSLDPQSFDLVLADVPCSNTGVLARRPEARWRFSGAELDKLARDQKALIGLAATFVAPGGKLVYSTCSIDPAENTEIARTLQRRDRRFKLIGEKLTLPGGATEPTNWHDGGYCAIFAEQG